MRKMRLQVLRPGRWVRIGVIGTCIGLVLMAIGLAVHTWRMGLPAGWPALVPSVLCLCGCVLLLWFRDETVRYLRRALLRRATVSGKRAAKKVVNDGVAQGQVLLTKGAEAFSDAGVRARETVQEAADDLGAELQRGWDRLGELRARTGRTSIEATRCPSCGRPQRPGARFCDACGVALPRICPACGAAQRVGSAFCFQCGHALAPPDQPPSQVQSPASIARHAR